jgi:Tfp pilus assembly protein PilN
MITINLLPEELRKIERVRKVKVNIAWLTGVAVIIALVIMVSVLVVIGRRMRQLAEMKARLDALTPQVEEAESLIRKKQDLVKEIALLDGFSSQRVLWNRKLNEISDVMPEELYLMKMSYSSRQQSAFIIQGEAIPGYGIEKVVEFIDALRRTGSFIRIFPQIDYSIESGPQGRKSFEVRCTQTKKEEKK